MVQRRLGELSLYRYRLFFCFCLLSCQEYRTGGVLWFFAYGVYINDTCFMKSMVCLLIILWFNASNLIATFFLPSTSTIIDCNHNPAFH